MIFEHAHDALEWALGTNAQTTVVLTLLILIVYFRKAIGLGSVLADWTGRITFALGVLVVLLVSGIISGIDVGAALEVARTILEVGLEIVDWLR